MSELDIRKEKLRKKRIESDKKNQKRKKKSI